MEGDADKVKQEVHICPILMKTVIWENRKCPEKCEKKECFLYDSEIPPVIPPVPMDGTGGMIQDLNDSDG